ncbi:putative S-adenosyl-L-methionine-dependent methyltransferase [Mycolicibacterium madagascariense]|uniref:S-adenosyl-L-methionine-dependent methyltransferase n=1 Tax=Mycolicibacterium madagascariense TaxID=212765 RepID=A0A7I7XAA1_9MYCO|nr:class I SAM-dependent methyltransferase [Mycolicibacterium madagascariense]MCV7014783.1 class I SAM-dependent methyltransferase [Mycolicibacterium madagascariense]BBZ26494.1 putative S-adenosyl-L-methionine-dependent methyltransferase [Mycolicibacterium madagascariense]
MTRTDDDDWDVTESVGATALGVAMARAAETSSATPLFVDQYAQWFIDAAIERGWRSPFDAQALAEADPEVAERIRERAQSIFGYAAVRTKHLDDFFLEAGAAGITQVVILAAGLDARAWRLPWTSDTVVFELDQPRVLDFKAETLRAHGAEPSARHVAVAVDLRQDWPTALQQNGFDPSRPTSWLAEGLLPYLPAAAQDLLFDRIQALSAADSRIAVEAFSPTFFDPEHQRRRREDMAKLRAAAGAAEDATPDVTALFYNEPRADVADWLRSHGWDVSTETTATLMARHKPHLSRDLQNPDSIFVEGRRLTGP